MDEWLSAGEVQTYLGLSQSKVNSLARSGEIPCKRAPGGYVFHREDVKAFGLGYSIKRVPPGLHCAYCHRLFHKEDIADIVIVNDVFRVLLHAVCRSIVAFEVRRVLRDRPVPPQPKEEP